MRTAVLVLERPVWGVTADPTETIWSNGRSSVNILML
jgi:hypothetical protein